MFVSTTEQELMRYFFGSDVAEPDGEDIPTMAAFRALGLDPDREPEALKVLLHSRKDLHAPVG